MWAHLVLTLAILRDAPAERVTCDVTRRAVSPAADDAPGLFTRVRSTERFMIALIREGYDRSPGFHDLVDVLQRSNVIVLVQPAPCAHGRIRSCLVSVTGSRRERHIRIHVDTHTLHDWLIATVAHELQHAVEIAEHPEVIDGPGALKLYRRIALGECRDGLSEECETARALATERRVLAELIPIPHSPAPWALDVQRQRRAQRVEKLIDRCGRAAIQCEVPSPSAAHPGIAVGTGRWAARRGSCCSLDSGTPFGSKTSSTRTFSARLLAARRVLRHGLPIWSRRCPAR
jgi:hypothetical protein